MSAVRALFLLGLMGLIGCHDGAPEADDPSEQFPGGETTNTLLLGVNAFIRPADNIETENEPAFYTGNSFFNQAWVQAPASTLNRDGLGPLFNARSCSTCHPKDGRGAPPINPNDPFAAILLRLSVPGTSENGGPVPHPVYGSQFQPFGITDVPGEGAPRIEYEEIDGSYDDGTPYTLLKPSYIIDDLQYGPLDSETLISPRVAPQVIGLGLLEAIPESRLLELEDPEDSNGDGISGRLNWVWDHTEKTLRPGRFGWKSDTSTLREQAGAAFAGDVGITSPVFPFHECGDGQFQCADAIDGGDPEIDERLFDFVVKYTALVAVPVRRKWKDPEVQRGKTLFYEIGCVSCHVGRHETGPHQLSELSDQTIWPYTDLLLHDMGDALGDNRPVFSATGNEWRTPPLWGVGLIQTVNKHTRFLHDGRARNLTEAILWHGGEAAASQAQFKKLSASDRASLVTFVESL